MVLLEAGSKTFVDLAEGPPEENELARLGGGAKNPLCVREPKPANGIAKPAAEATRNNSRQLIRMPSGHVPSPLPDLYLCRSAPVGSNTPVVTPGLIVPCGSKAKTPFRLSESGGSFVRPVRLY